MRVRASSRPEILQAGAVKGLITSSSSFLMTFLSKGFIVLIFLSASFSIQYNDTLLILRKEIYKVL